MPKEENVDRTNEIKEIKKLDDHETRLHNIEKELIKILSSDEENHENKLQEHEIKLANIQHEKRLANIEHMLEMLSVNISHMINTDHLRSDEHNKEGPKDDMQEQTPSGEIDNKKLCEIKPVDVFQINNYPDTDLGSHTAEAAIDGQKETHMHTNYSINPWWCADMGGVFHVKMAAITNRHDCCQERSENLRVGVTNTKPVAGQNLDLNAYTLCEERPGLMGDDSIVKCPDGVTGRYLIVQLRTTTWMHIAEVNLFGYSDPL